MAMHDTEAPGSAAVCSATKDDLATFVEHIDHVSQFWNNHSDEVGAYMREQCPVKHSSAHGGFWVLARYEDILQAAKDHETFSVGPGKLVPGEDPEKRSRVRPGEVDPPDHRAYRRALNPWLRQSAVEPLLADFRAVADELIAQFVDAGTCDIAQSYSIPFPPLAFFRHVLGLPESELPEIRDLVTRAVFARDTKTNTQAYKDLGEWSRRLLNRYRGRDDADGIIGAVLNARVNGEPLSEREQLETMIPVMIGGLDTSSSVIGTGVRLLAENPDVQRDVVANPELIGPLVEEFLRLGAPSSLFRNATRDVEIQGQTIHKGDKVMLPYPIGNRDPTEFEDPDSLRLDRIRNRHLAFGGGAHRCVGSNLGREFVAVAIERLLARIEDIELVPGQPAVYESVQLRALRSLHITYRRREPAGVPADAATAGAA
jgi:cytochrome P450